MSALAGRRIVVTRPEAQSAELVAALRAHGAEPVVFPVMVVRPVADTAPLDRALERLGQFSWVAFTSANAVECVLDRAAARGVPIPGRTRLAAVGRATGQALRTRGYRVRFVPTEFRAAALGRELPEVAGRRVLLPVAKEETGEAAVELLARGADVERVVVYETLPVPLDAARDPGFGGGVDAVTFFSPSAVTHFFALLGERAMPLLAGAAVACIGPVTATAVHERGLEPTVMAEEYTAEGVVAALERYFRARTPGVVT
ncbi:MAG TPA: uroporphyrinogen-III synthase [Gemmatimonadales bacterium]